MNDAFNELFGAAFHQTSKGEVVLRIFGKVLLVCGMFLTGCANDRESATGPFFPTRNMAQYSGEDGDETAYWDGAGSGGKPRIVIDLEQQRAYFYKGGKIVGISVVSTGREGYDTPSGEFRIIQKDLTHVSSIYGDYVDRSGQVVIENVDVTKDRRPRGTVFRGAPMPYFLRIHGGIGMHAGYLPGYPASHGCIRLPKEMAIHFFQNAAIGTPVAIRQESPQDHEPGPFVGERDSPFSAIMER
ncbi:MAG TPA: L,D-transpeptidase family protein [Chthoniobacterales bacterium]